MKERSLVKSGKDDIGYDPEELKDLIVFDAVSKYKPVAGAIGRAGVNGRTMNEYKKDIYGRLTGKAI